MPARKAFQPGKLAVLAYDRLRSFEFAIAAEVFVLPRPSLGVPWYQSRVIAVEPGPLRGIADMEIHARNGLRTLAGAQTIIIPGWRDLENPPPQALVRALQRAHARGARLLSICSGSWLLASAGLLDGKQATTHWLYFEQMRARFPKVQLREDVLYVDEGQIITSAGSAAGIDACLHLVRRDYGADIANTIARRMVAAPHREGGQAQYVAQPLPKSELREGQQMSAVMQWAQANLQRSIRVDDLARRAAMSTRNFQRLFAQATGTSPAAWLLAQRIGLARRLLEKNQLPIGRIAEACGFATDIGFRVAFRKQLGVPPAAYRKRFAFV